MKSTWPVEMSVSRWALGACTHVMSLSAAPSSLATYLATSTSKPVYSLPFFRPSPGWSNLMPMVSLPVSLARWATDLLSASCFSLSLPQAVALSASAAAAAKAAI